MKNDLVYLGKLGRAVGLRGEMRIILETDFLEQFKKGTFLYLADSSVLTIESIELNKNHIKFLNIDSPEIASKYTNKEIFSTYEETRKNCKLKEGQFFWFDLIGLNVMEDDLLLGITRDISRFTGSDYFEIETSEELCAQGMPKSFLIPYIPNFIKNVDLNDKKINVQNSLDILKNS